MQEVESKEVTLVRQQATKALNAANEITIENQESYESAVDLLSKIKTVGKMVKDRKEQITRPLMESPTSVRDLFKPIEQSHADAEKIIKTKMLSYQQEQEERQRIESERIAARVEKGTMRQETAIKKMEEMPTVQTSVKGKVGSVATRTIKKVRITDEAALPREYLMPDMGKITTAAIREGVSIPGVEVYEEKVISAR